MKKLKYVLIAGIGICVGLGIGIGVGMMTGGKVYKEHKEENRDGVIYSIDEYSYFSKDGNWSKHVYEEVKDENSVKILYDKITTEEKE